MKRQGVGSTLQKVWRTRMHSLEWAVKYAWVLNITQPSDKFEQFEKCTSSSYCNCVLSLVIFCEYLMIMLERRKHSRRRATAMSCKWKVYVCISYQVVLDIAGESCHCSCILGGVVTELRIIAAAES